MSFSRKDHNRRTGAVARGLASIGRRVAVALSDAGVWQFDGFEGETPFTEVPAFQGIGFASRPSGDTDAEAILIRLGEEHYAAVGFRDEDIRLSLEQGETAIFNKAGAYVKITADGDIECSPAAGRQVKLGASATDGVIKGTTRDTAEQVFLTALSTFVGTIVDGTGAPSAAKATFVTAIGTFATAASAAVSIVSKTE